MPIKIESDEEMMKTETEDHPGLLSNFPLSEATVEKLKARGVEKLFPVQYETYHPITDGRDVIAQARTGTGKTFAFALPLIEKLQSKDKKLKKGRKARVLILAPTRELANQISTDFQSVTSCELSVLPVYGGVSYEIHRRGLQSGVDIVVGTPGRMKDLLEQGDLSLARVHHVVLDEVDRMLDMGFLPDVEAILEAVYEEGRKCQTLLFSATLPPWVEKAAGRYLGEDVFRVCLVEEKDGRTATTVEHLALQCPYEERANTLGDVIRVYSSGSESRCIVFCERKKDADELASHEAMHSACHVLHGDIPQDKRELVLKKFREGKYRVLVTTNVAARGLDVPAVDLVIQCHPPKDVEDYIHRSGRTGRAGRPGVCVCFYTHREKGDLQQLEHRANITFKRISSPTAEEIAQSSHKDTNAALEKIPEATWSVFKEAACSLIADLGAERALACALAKMSGLDTEIKPRSVLSAREGFTAYHLKTTQDDIRGKGYAYMALKRKLPEEVVEQIKYLVFTKGKTGFVFDLPCEADTVVDENWEDGRYDMLEKLTAIPELEEEFNISTSNGGGGGFGGRGGFRGGRGGFRGGRGGFGDGGGRGRGGFGDRGRGRGGSRGNNKRSGAIDLSGPPPKAIKLED